MVVAAVGEHAQQTAERLDVEARRAVLHLMCTKLVATLAIEKLPRTVTCKKVLRAGASKKILRSF